MTKSRSKMMTNIVALTVLLVIPIEARSQQNDIKTGFIDYDEITNDSSIDKSLAAERAKYRKIRQKMTLRFNKAIAVLEQQMKLSSGVSKKEHAKALALKKREFEDYKLKFHKEFKRLGFDYMLREYKRIDQVAARLSRSGRYTIIYVTGGLGRKLMGEAWINGKKVKLEAEKLPGHCKDLTEIVIEYLTNDKYRPRLY